MDGGDDDITLRRAHEYSQLKNTQVPLQPKLYT